MSLNKLHINLDKSCFMYFSKNLKNPPENYENECYPPIMIGSTEIKQVSETKFLGVVIDERLSWEPHIKALSKKLASCTGSINQISKSMPRNLFRDLYFTLFESYMTYGVTVWGSVTCSKINNIFKSQKKITRVLFGDRDKYLDKFMTCVRARPYLEQKLPPEFYIKEPSKPIFNANKILNIENLYFYHTAIETFKILKYKSPTIAYESYKLSSRSNKGLFILTPQPNRTFQYNSSVIWNKVRNFLKTDDSATSVASLKSNLRSKILLNQSLGDTESWIEHNFMKYK